MVSTAVVVFGILLPASFVRSELFAVLAAFVAINTIMYTALAVGKILPKVYVGDYIASGRRRGESRSIHPDQ